MSDTTVTARRHRLPKALADIHDGLRGWELWVVTGLRDVRRRYGRSVIGPFWMTLNMGIMILALGFLFGTLFGRPVKEFVPYVGLGLIVWHLVSGLIMEGSQTFITAAGVIRNVRTPMSGLIFRVIWRNLVVFAYNSVLYVFLLIFFEVALTPSTLLVIPGLMIVCLNAVWFAMLFGTISTRYRDVPPTLASITQVLFLLSPIIWKKDQLADYEYLVLVNPIYHFVEIIRMPLLGMSPDWTTWAVVLGITFCGLLAGFEFFVRFRERIAIWL